MEPLPKVTFLFSMEPDLVPFWKDGLWAALRLLESEFDITHINLQEEDWTPTNESFVLGWGAFGSPVDNLLRQTLNIRKGLCLAGYAPLTGLIDYDVIFYENKWSRDWMQRFIDGGNITGTKFIHAFGVNVDVFKPDLDLQKKRIWDYTSVGAFATWKRHELLTYKSGRRLAVGQMQKNNIDESFGIVFDLVSSGVAVSDTVSPNDLATIYNLTNTVYIPATESGGGERAVLEARACGVNVEIEPDNLKLKELKDGDIWDHYYYARQLKEAIL